MTKTVVHRFLVWRYLKHAGIYFWLGTVHLLVFTNLALLLMYRNHSYLVGLSMAPTLPWNECPRITERIWLDNCTRLIERRANHNLSLKRSTDPSRQPGTWAGWLRGSRDSSQMHYSLRVLFSEQHLSLRACTFFSTHSLTAS